MSLEVRRGELRAESLRPPTRRIKYPVGIGARPAATFAERGQRSPRAGWQGLVAGDPAVRWRRACGPSLSSRKPAGEALGSPGAGPPAALCSSSITCQFHLSQHGRRSTAPAGRGWGSLGRRRARRSRRQRWRRSHDASDGRVILAPTAQRLFLLNLDHADMPSDVASSYLADDSRAVASFQVDEASVLAMTVARPTGKPVTG
jgi:hypothetical protein